jgi:hypothetical protein
MDQDLWKSLGIFRWVYSFIYRYTIFLSMKYTDMKYIDIAILGGRTD